MTYEQSEADERFVAHAANCKGCSDGTPCEGGYRLHEAAVTERVRLLRLAE